MSGEAASNGNVLTLNNSGFQLHYSVYQFQLICANTHSGVYGILVGENNKLSEGFPSTRLPEALI